MEDSLRWITWSTICLNGDISRPRPLILKDAQPANASSPSDDKRNGDVFLKMLHVSRRWHSLQAASPNAV